VSTQSTSEYLWRTPPYCPTVECYMHRDEEHHVAGCPAYDAMGQAIHRAADEFIPPWTAVQAELRRSRLGRVVMACVLTWTGWKAGARRFGRQASRWFR
jgi:hypothetical protein